MSYVQVDSLSLSFGERAIFSDVHLTLSPGTKIALTGANGSGKSTLMKAIANIVECDSGKIISPKNTRTAYLPQSGIVHRGNSLYDEVHLAYEKLAQLEKESRVITEKLSALPEDQETLLQRYQEILDILDGAEWDRRNVRIEQVLIGLGFKRSDFTKDVSTFSGGWQMRMALAKILLESPDILLLDEPTNYLDLEAREWLRDFIQSYSGAVMLVSHDRAFLDATCGYVAEVLMTKVNLFTGKFSAYEEFRAKSMTALVERWKRQQEEIARIEAFINRFRYKDSKAVQVQSRVKMLEKMERIEIPPALKRIKFHFPKAPHSGKIVLRGENLAKRYGVKTVFDDVDIELNRGSRTAVVGYNGAGKSSLLRIISGEDKNYDGTLKFGSAVVCGYFSQEQDSVLDSSLTVLESALQDSDVGEGKLRNLLGGFLFSGDDIHKKVGVLSGGERNRLALLKILLKPVNLLILDEPTNHLDITSKDILLEALYDFDGTLVIVSHDRYFLERIADGVLEIKEGKAQMFLGDYAYYRWKTDEKTSPPKEEIPPKHSSTGIKKLHQPGLSREKQKEYRARISKLQKEEKLLTAQLEEKEEQVRTIQRELENPENYSDSIKAQALSEELRKLEEHIEQISSAWEEAAIALEEAKTAP